MEINNPTKKAILMATIAAMFYGLSSPISKVLLKQIPPTLMAALLYLGAGIGISIIIFIQNKQHKQSSEAKITKKEMPFVLAMIILDILAPIFLMIGLTLTTAGSTSLLNNFEIVATALIAMFAFKESVGKRMWIALFFITLASIILSFEDVLHFQPSIGALFVLLASICWGLENNCTRVLSIKDPLEIVVIKGLGSGLGALLIAFSIKAFSNNWLYIGIALFVGFIAYGLSLYLYISAQRHLGATRTSAYYAAAPFLGVLASWFILKEPVNLTFFIALVIMIIGTYFMISEEHQHDHTHIEMTHEHKHSHSGLHHTHSHDYVVKGAHSHEHTHHPMTHRHNHTPDLHHWHSHQHDHEHDA